MNTTFFIPINSSSIAFYFGKALILPAIFLNNKPEDIQNRIPNSILLSKTKWVKNSDCSIEVILTVEEQKEIIYITDNFYQLTIPLPISRIIKIYFLDKKQMDTTIWNINNGAAFIPQHLISTENISNIDFVDNNFNPKEIANNSKTEIEKKVSRYDTVLGGFAFMKVGGKDFGKILMEFSENYFITLSYFNKLVEEQTQRAEKEKNIIFNRKYIGLFSKNDSEWIKWQPYIYKNIELQDVEDIAMKDGFKIERKLGLINLDSIDKQSHLYDIAILATYGERKNKSTDDLVNSLHNGIIPENKVEDIALLFGLNTGYGKLRNKYKTSNNEYAVKFKLDSKLDYYTIESIYQFTFNNNKNNYTFDFIDHLGISQSSKYKISGFETYTILDKTIIAKKKQTPLEFFLEKSSIGIYETLSNSTRQSLPIFATIDNDKAIKYYENLLKNVLVSSIQQFEKNVSNECQENFDNEKQTLISRFEDEINSLKNENQKLKHEISSLAKSKEIKEDNSNLVELVTKNEMENIVREPDSIESGKNYNELSLPDLKKVAKDLKIKGYSSKSKEELLTLIKNTPVTPTLL